MHLKKIINKVTELSLSIIVLVLLWKICLFHLNLFPFFVFGFRPKLDIFGFTTSAIFSVSFSSTGPIYENLAKILGRNRYWCKNHIKKQTLFWIDLNSIKNIPRSYGNVKHVLFYILKIKGKFCLNDSRAKIYHSCFFPNIYII